MLLNAKYVCIFIFIATSPDTIVFKFSADETYAKYDVDVTNHVTSRHICLIIDKTSACFSIPYRATITISDCHTTKG